jgi:hypothetical protein
VTVTLQAFGDDLMGKPASKSGVCVLDDISDRETSERQVKRMASTRAMETFRDLLVLNDWVAEDDPMIVCCTPEIKARIKA